ncbi:ATP-binding protein [Kineococcus rhizosphaerae]|uniref:Histidine kinase-like protein n=1 Tax=Kineococcus rhizosphaerae TaxID=559628 RepID=A0A2T0R5S9_9ACTN|nr:ATP-binding protein [Kineococcus rhizosphaerae]PRY16077.1 histidine kinase-like protein [Kineococcus rhizosphaerae]
MPTVTLRFSPMAEHVRTARLVAVSVARRAGFGEDQLDEIRIAIGEACARAVAGGALQTAAGPAVGLVDMRLCDDRDGLDVTVVQCDVHGEPLVAGPGPLATEDPLSLALMAGMADSSGQAGTSGGLRLSWKLSSGDAVGARAF